MKSHLNSWMYSSVNRSYARGFFENWEKMCEKKKGEKKNIVNRFRFMGDSHFMKMWVCIRTHNKNREWERAQSAMRWDHKKGFSFYCCSCYIPGLFLFNTIVVVPRVENVKFLLCLQSFIFVRLAIDEFDVIQGCRRKNIVFLQQQQRMTWICFE